MHSDIYEPNWFKLGMMVDTTKLCWDTSVNDLHRGSRSQCEKTQTSVPTVEYKVFISLNGIWCAVETS